MTHATALKAGFDAFRSAVRLVRETLGGDDKTRTAAPPGAAPAAPNLHAQLQALQQSPRVGERFAQDRMQRACLRLRHGALTLSGGTGSLIKDTSLP